jgi:hypothetical protein
MNIDTAKILIIGTFLFLLIFVGIITLIIEEIRYNKQREIDKKENKCMTGSLHYYYPGYYSGGSYPRY